MNEKEDEKKNIKTVNILYCDCIFIRGEDKYTRIGTEMQYLTRSKILDLSNTDTYTEITFWDFHVQFDIEDIMKVNHQSLYFWASFDCNKSQSTGKYDIQNDIHKVYKVLIAYKIDKSYFRWNPGYEKTLDNIPMYHYDKDGLFKEWTSTHFNFAFSVKIKHELDIQDDVDDDNNPCKVTFRHICVDILQAEIA